MPWNACPPAMKHLAEIIRAKAIEIADAERRIWP